MSGSPAHRGIRPVCCTDRAGWHHIQDSPQCHAFHEHADPAEAERKGVGETSGILRPPFFSTGQLAFNSVRSSAVTLPRHWTKSDSPAWVRRAPPGLSETTRLLVQRGTVCARKRFQTPPWLSTPAILEFRWLPLWARKFQAHSYSRRQICVLAKLSSLRGVSLSNVSLERDERCQCVTKLRIKDQKDDVGRSLHSYVPWCASGVLLQSCHRSCPSEGRKWS